MFSRAMLFGLGAAAVAFCASATAGTVVGWFNGEPVDQFYIGLTNGINDAGYPAANVYEDFIVPAGGWTVTGMFG